MVDFESMAIDIKQLDSTVKALNFTIDKAISALSLDQEKKDVGWDLRDYKKLLLMKWETKTIQTRQEFT